MTVQFWDLTINRILEQFVLKLKKLQASNVTKHYSVLEYLQLQQKQGFYFFAASLLIMKTTLGLTCKKPSVSNWKQMCFISKLDIIRM